MARNENIRGYENSDDVTVPQYFEKEIVTVYKENVSNSGNSSQDGSNSSCDFAIAETTLSDEMIRAEKKLLRTLDFFYVMPFICLLMIIQYFDKSALNFSSLLGIKEDNHVNDKQFAWLGSIFHIGYLLYQAPNAYLMQKLPLSKYLGSVIILWGAILGMTSLSKSFTHLMVFRFLLGVFEASVLPCTIIIVNRLYRKQEQATRFCIVFMMGGFAMAVGGLLSYGIGHMDGIAGLKAWQWIMIILSSITVMFGVISYFVMIDDAISIARSEKVRAVVRLRTKDSAVVVSQKINFRQIREALTEVRFYCFMLVGMLLNLQHGVLSIFSAIITKGFGFSNLNAILLTCPMGLMSIVYIFSSIAIQRKYKNSAMYTGIAFALMSTIGLVLLLIIPIPPAKLIGLYMCISYIPVALVVITNMSINVSGYTKKIFYSSCYSFFQTAGNFIGPQMIIPAQAPLYLGAMLTCIAANTVCMVALYIARRSMVKLNRERENNLSAKEYSTYNNGDVDITDVENVHFIYAL